LRITLAGTGDLKRIIGEKHQIVDLQDNAVVADLFPIIDERWGSVFPPHIWNNKKLRFRGPVIIVINEKATQDMNLQLNHGDHILLVKALVGG
jgi:hypothetical protein